MLDATIRAFVAQQREWLEQELHAEDDDPTTTTVPAKQGAPAGDKRRDAVLHPLDVDSVTVGLYGRTVVRLTLVQQQQATGVALLPSHRFTTGDEVEIRTKSSSGSSRRRNPPAGVVSAVTEDSISVALFPASSNHTKKKQQQQSKQSKDNEGDDDEDDDDLLGGSSPPYSLIPRSNVQVHRKLMAALDELDSHGVNHPVAGKIVQALFEVGGDSTTVSNKSSSTATILSTNDNTNWNNPNLDESQLEAIQFALQNNQSLSLIHGPPGTCWNFVQRKS